MESCNWLAVEVTAVALPDNYKLPQIGSIEMELLRQRLLEDDAFTQPDVHPAISTARHSHKAIAAYTSSGDAHVDLFFRFKARRMCSEPPTERDLAGMLQQVCN